MESGKEAVWSSRPVDETEHADVFLTGRFKDESRMLRHVDWQNTVTMGTAGDRVPPAVSGQAAGRLALG